MLLVVEHCLYALCTICFICSVQLERSRWSEYSRPVIVGDIEQRESSGETNGGDGAEEFRSSRRKLMLLSSPSLPYASCHFSIAGSGVHGSELDVAND